MKNFFTKLHYAKIPTSSEKFLLKMLAPLSYTYCAITEIRNTLYKLKILRPYTPKVTTISIGNITTGGTGKTPITAALTNYLTQKGYNVAILSRGYGSQLDLSKANVISDGENIFYDAKTGGDEPVWLAENCRKAIILTSSNRVQIAKKAEEMGCNLLILDDGFQHQKLSRNINIAVIDSEKQFGNRQILPAGPLREPIKNLSRADKVIVMCKNAQDPTDDLIKEIKKYNANADIIICKAKAEKIYNIQNNKEETLVGKKILAFSAIGQPEQFYNLLRHSGAYVTRTMSFADHYNYKTNDIEKIIDEANKFRVALIVTTEKDAVKIKDITDEAIYALKLGIDWDAENILK